MAAATFSGGHMAVMCDCFGHRCGNSEPTYLICVWCDRTAHRSCCKLRSTDALGGTLVCGDCVAELVVHPEASTEQLRQSVLDGYRVLLFNLTSNGASTVAAVKGVLNKVAVYEEEKSRQLTLKTQFGLEMMLSWLCVQLGQAQSLPSVIFAVSKLEDGVNRDWLKSDSFKKFVKRLTKLYGRKPDTAKEVTVDMVHAALGVAEKGNSGDSWRDKVIVLLLFLGAYRVGEVAGYLRGLRAPNILLGPECVILTKEDSKTKAQASTTFVVNETDSGLRLGEAVRGLLQEMQVPTRQVAVGLRGKLVWMDQPDYYTADLWFAQWRSTHGHVVSAADTALSQLKLLMTDKEWPQLGKLAGEILKSAKTRSGTARNLEEQYLCVFGGTEQEMTQLQTWAADKYGLKLTVSPGSLIGGTAAVAGWTGRQWAPAPLSTGQASKIASGLFRQAAVEGYMETSGMGAAQANARAAKEKWVSHGGRRGFTTEVLARLAQYRAKHPGEVAEDSEHLLNIHADWVSDEATTQEHYTGMRPLAQMLLLTKVC